MKLITRNLKYIAAASVAVAIGISASNAIGQTAVAAGSSKAEYKEKDKDKGFCNNNNWSDNDRVSVNELRESTVASSGSLNVNAGKNGGISVKGEDRSDVQVRACVQSWAKSGEEAKASLSTIRINTGGEITADGPADGNWSVSFQILVPRQTNVNLTAHNGGISISGTDGNADFTTMNGGVNVTNVSGNVKGRTTNGGVNVSLSGASWKGSGLDLETTNGGVNLTVPSNFAAHVETGTVNGGFKSDIPALNVTTEDVKGESSHGNRSKRIVTNLNGGGAPVRIITTNGGIKINNGDKE